MTKSKPLRLPPMLPGDRAYFQALGRFMHEFAVVETQTYFLLRRCAGVSKQMAKVLFAGLHADQSAKYVKEILQFASLDQSLDDDLKAAITQLKHINNFRNDLVHFGALIYASGGKMRWTTNVHKARTKESLRKFPAAPEILRDATHDLLKIHEHFMAYGQTNKNALGDAFALWPWHKKFLRAAWRYKPPSAPARE